MNVIQFGGPLGAMPGWGMTVHPSCQGEASLPADARADLVQAVPVYLMKHTTQQVTQWFAAGKGSGAQMIAELSASISASVSAELGVNVTMGSFRVNFSEEDKAALAARAKEHRMAKIAEIQANEAAVAAQEDPVHYYGPNDRVVRFAGPLGAMPGLGITLHPDTQGHAALPSDARDDVVLAAPACIVRHVALQVQVLRWFTEDDSRPTEQRQAALTAAIGAAASAELGVTVNVGLLKMEVSEQDAAALAGVDDAPKTANKPAAPPQAAGPYGGAPPVPVAVAPPVPVAGAAGVPATKKSGALFAIVGGAVLAIAVALGLVWHFKHAEARAPAAHEHARGKH